ncbi:sarcosine/dimethylglycine N-methyltransferase [Spinactinospora alkalitolerans]|uniref:Sarcosine/dimethylglycine N-methyltransferase n=1 Tax=Spinactinospora alkalitolerans TaxID=687207 RepID=A0A852TT51_9ACTN|nr:methyltransferase domain-containing protein [Spinactinospora alkalitolerans]NYE45294.1 sarcosine/dimethylglycine N-methyltransferase [Spinactinospora alkalitolerans]
MQRSRTITTQDQQFFGDDPLAIRDTDHYTDEYVTGFVEKWDELIDWKRRYASEGTFFIDQLKARGVREVLDVATGTGFHSVRLIEEGFETVSVDGSPEMLAKAFANGMSFGGHILRVVHADWRWLNRDVHGSYDAIICLGNSFTHLFSERDRRKALAEFYAMLKHDGVLIIDQRNYDALLDGAYANKHTYYYCGEEVSAEPEHIDEGLARFVYRFPDESTYHLNMFPLRKNYMRRLMREVGFQRIETFGDFQETYRGGEPDFYIHIAEKAYEREGDPTEGYSSAVRTARDYYNSTDADNFYYLTWGGSDIHVGVYERPDEEIATASRRTVERMAGALDLGPETRVVDLGSGYGGSARYLARTYGCHVTCLNLSEVENARNREMTERAGLAHLIDVVDGSFEEIPAQDNAYDVVWSQDALLHSGDRTRVLEEVARVLRRDGHFIFTDPMAADGASRESLLPILDRLHLDTMGTPEFYTTQAQRLGLRPVGFDDLTPHLSTHYGRVLAETMRRNDELAAHISTDYLDRMRTGLRNWVKGGEAGDLAWGIMHFRK